jgi:hypothetical protein
MLAPDDRVGPGVAYSIRGLLSLRIGLSHAGGAAVMYQVVLLA